MFRTSGDGFRETPNPSYEFIHLAASYLRQINPTGKISLSPSGKSPLRLPPSCPRGRGVGHRYRTLGWDAVDAAASGAQVNCRAGFGLSQTRERPNGAQTNGVVAYGKTVWFRHPLLVSSRRRRVGPTGRGYSVNSPMTVTNRIRRRGERGISRKARECRIASAEPVCSCAFF